MRIFSLSMAAAAAVAATAAPALAAPIVMPTVTPIYQPGVTAAVNHGDNVYSNNFTDTKVPLPAGVFIYSGDVDGKGKTPLGTVGNYLAVTGGASYTLNLPAAVPVLSFLVGTLDAGNSITIGFNNNSFVTYLASSFGTVDKNIDGRLTFDTGSSSLLINSVNFASSTNSLEIANIQTAAPEPAAWGLMILGFGLAGAGLRSRRRRGTVAIA